MNPEEIFQIYKNAGEDFNKNNHFCSSSFVFTEIDRKIFDIGPDDKTRLPPEKLAELLNNPLTNEMLHKRIIEVMAKFIEMEDINSLDGIRNLLGEPDDLSPEEKEKILSQIEDFFNRNKDL